METFKGVIFFLGLIFGLMMISLIILSIIELIKGTVKRKRDRRIQKNRFNKPPTANCYCRDCKHWIATDGECMIFDGWSTKDSWFCWQAEPTDKLRDYK